MATNPHSDQSKRIAGNPAMSSAFNVPSRDGRQVTAANAADVARWINASGGNGSFDALSDGVLVSTPEDDLMAYPGDWVLRLDGKFSVFSERPS
jgi:hypothetical protein